MSSWPVVACAALPVAVTADAAVLTSAASCLNTGSPSLTGLTAWPSPPASFSEPASAAAAPFFSAFAPARASCRPAGDLRGAGACLAEPGVQLAGAGAGRTGAGLQLAGAVGGAGQPRAQLLAPSPAWPSPFSRRPRSFLPPLSSLAELFSPLGSALRSLLWDTNAPGPTTESTRSSRARLRW